VSTNLEITYRPHTNLPAVRMVVDGSKHAWDLVAHAMAAKIIPGFNPDRPDPVFDSIMAARAEAAKPKGKNANHRN